MSELAFRDVYRSRTKFSKYTYLAIIVARRADGRGGTPRFYELQYRTRTKTFVRAS